MTWITFGIAMIAGYIGASLLSPHRGWAGDPHKQHGPTVNLNESRRIKQPGDQDDSFYLKLWELLRHLELHDFGER